MAGGAIGPIYERLNQAGGYHPFTADTFADWSVQAGDIVTIQKNGENYEAPIYTSHMVWRGSTPQTTFETTGNTERESISKLGERRYGSSADGASLSGGYSGGGYRGSGISSGRMAQAEESISMALWDIEDMDKQYTSQFNMTAHQIDMVSAIVDANGSILQQAGLYLDAQGVLIYAEDATKPDYLSSRFSVQAGRIQSVVEKTGVEDPQFDDSKSLFTRVTQTETAISTEASRAESAENTLNTYIRQNASNISLIASQSELDALSGEGRTLTSKVSVNASNIALVVNNGSIDAASIVLAVNSRTGEGVVKISAKQVDLGSYATVEMLRGVEGSFERLTAGQTTVTALRAELLQAASTLNVAGSDFKSTPFRFGNTFSATILSTANAAIDFDHAHSMTINNTTGVVTIGGAVVIGNASATFRIADTAYFQQQMSAYQRAGWTLARSYVDPPEQNTSSASFMFGVPDATYDTQTNYRYTVSCDKEHAYIKNASGIIVAQTDNNWYANGWAAARAMVVTPPQKTNSATMTVKIPAVSVDEQSNLNFTVKCDSNYAYIENASRITVARVTNPVTPVVYGPSDLHIWKSQGKVLLYLANYVTQRTANIEITSLVKSQYSNAWNIKLLIDDDVEFTFSKLPTG